MMSYNFYGEKYSHASKHQKEWADEILSGFKLKGDEKILALGSGDWGIAFKLAELVPEGHVIELELIIRKEW